MKRYMVRSVDFVGSHTFPQGLGLTYDDVEVECGPDEEIFAIDRTQSYEGTLGNYVRPVLRAWIRRQITQESA